MNRQGGLSKVERSFTYKVRRSRIVKLKVNPVIIAGFPNFTGV